MAKVNFVVAELKDYISSLQRLLDEDWAMGHIFSKYPQLKERLNQSKDKSKTIKSFFSEQEKKFLPVMISEQKGFQDSWDKINDKVFSALEEIHETKFPAEVFSARVTLNPICPRNLNANRFDIYFGMAHGIMKTVVAHELSHFIFFAKFKEIFPKLKPEERESPNIIWKLSESVPAVIFNDKRILKIFEPVQGAVVYNSITKIDIDGKPLLETLQEFYDKRKSFEDFIRKSYEFFKLHEKEINF